RYDDRWTRRDSWEVLGARFFHECARGAEICVSEGDVLIRCVELLFETIQLRVVEHLPPLAADHGVGRPREFPVVGFLESVRRDFFVSRRRSDRRLRILRRLVTTFK